MVSVSEAGVGPLVSTSPVRLAYVGECEAGRRLIFDATWCASQISSTSTMLEATLALRMSSVDESTVAVIGIGESSTFVIIQVEAYMLTLPMSDS